MARRPPPRPRPRPAFRHRLSAVPRWAWVVLALLAGIIAYAAISHYQAEQPSVTAPSNRALLLSRATTLLRTDPSIADAIYSAPRDQWDVTPAEADVDPLAFGRYVCFLLGQAAVTGAHSSVRVIDGTKLEASDFDYAAASRGTIGCEEGEQ